MPMAQAREGMSNFIEKVVITAPWLAGDLDQIEVLTENPSDTNAIWVVLPKRHIILMNEEWRNVISLLRLFKGNELEVQCNLVSGNVVRPGSFWDDWVRQSSFQFYIDKIHPMVLAAVIDIIKQNFVSQETVEILDIFGGRGNFLSTLHLRIARERVKQNIHLALLDNNEKSLTSAHRILDGLSPAVTVYEATDMTAEAGWKGVLTRRPHLITAIGGLNRCVVTRSQALQIARDVFDVLENGGFLVVTGLSPVLLTANDFKNIGFEVLNMSVPEHINVDHVTWLSF